MPTKKTIKKTTVKKTSPVKAATTSENKCMCAENCKCHGHGCAHFVKHIIIWAIIFALGMVCGKMICGCHNGMKHMSKMNPVFENGCLKMDSINCPKMAENLIDADVNGDECISIEEYKAVKKEMRGHKGMRGPRMDK